MLSGIFASPLPPIFTVYNFGSVIFESPIIWSNNSIPFASASPSFVITILYLTVSSVPDV